MRQPPDARPDTELSHYRMIDVSAKAITTRSALAEGRIYLGAHAFRLLSERRLPKGDALVLAEIAGIMAAKNTAILLPLCHPLPIEAVRITCVLEPEHHAVQVRCQATANAKTGVEMEALVGVQAALLTIYDLCKGTEPNLSIGDIRLLEKLGGKSGHWTHGLALGESETPGPAESNLHNIKTALITISDRCSQGVSFDHSGAWLRAACEQQGATLCQVSTVSDDMDAIQSVVMQAVRDHTADLIITTGGTGLSARDITPEAMRMLWDRPVPGFGELLRSSGATHTQKSFLSRSGAGMIGSCLTVNLPGSLQAVQQGFACLLPILPHALHIIAGGQHERSSP